MAIRDKILKIRSIGFVRLILILILVLPAGMVIIGCNDFSGRFKVESVSSNKRKPFIGYHFLKCHRQLVNCFKNKLSFNDRTLEFGRTLDLHFKMQRSGFLNIKEKLTDIFHFVFMSFDNDVEKWIVV